MKSSKSLFSKTVFKSNIKRFLPFSVLYAIIECIILPLIIFSAYNPKKPLGIDEFAALNGISDVFAFGFAGIFALLTFWYLFTSNKCNALHAFPIGRSSLFVTNFISAYVLLVVPQIIGYAISLPGLFMYGEMIKESLLLAVTSIFVFSFICLSIAVLAIMLAGNAFSGWIIYCILNFTQAALFVIASGAISVFGIGLYSSDNIIAEGNYFLSPLINLMINRIKLINVYNGTDESSKYYMMLAIYAALCILICLLALCLYKKRELECAGEMTVFSVEIPFIRVIVAIIGASMLSFIIGSFLETQIYYLILYIIFFFVVYFATQMILMKKGNVFTKGLVARAVVVCAVTVGIVLGASAYSTNYLPDVKKVESVRVNTTYNLDLKDDEAQQKAAELQKALIEYSKNDDSSSWFSSGVKEYDENTISIQFDYTMKNGKLVSRSYDYDAKDKKINAMITALEKEAPYQTVFEYLESLDIDCTVTSINCYNNSKPYADDINIDTKDYDAFLNLCKEDFNTIKSNYSSLGGRNLSDDWSITISCSIPKDTNKAIIDEINQTLYSREAQLYVDTFSPENANKLTLDINIYSLPKNNSKVAEFLNSYQQAK